MDDLDEDPRVAFMQLVNIAQKSLTEQLSRFDPREDWDDRNELRHRFMNVVVASAKRYEVEPFLSLQVPRLADFNEQDHRQFQADLDHYVTQLVLDHAMRSKQDSVAILPRSKDNIRRYVFELKRCVEQASMSDSKREALLRRLDEFESELEKRRLNLLAVTRLTFELLAIPGALWASAEVAHRLISNFMQTVAESKTVETESQRIAPASKPKALSPPRNIETTRKPAAVGGGRSMDLDDDIPF
ncbi:MAG: hypothetical protein KGM42_07205 [Hyphomicrobiales bacterium]|nr:hypothetical protein [Hyphomicrobiales bacterium]